MTEAPGDLAAVEGSERHPAPDARLVGPADPQERMSVTVVLRRRPDGDDPPDFDHFLTTPPSARPRLSQTEFAERYGASPDDIDRVTAFLTAHGLSIQSTNTASRSIVAAGTVAQMSETFGVALATYEHPVARRARDEPTLERYRGRDGAIYVPAELADVVIGVFGLDDRRITKRNAADPPNTTGLSTETIARLYNFPTNSAAGQTIAIFSEAGYHPADISASFGGSPPTIRDIAVNGVGNDGTADSETTQDIVIAAKAAPGAAIAVYFTSYTQQGWVDLIQRVAHPQPGDPVCSVLSSSFYVSDGDDAASLAAGHVSVSWLRAVTEAFQDAAIQGVTVCIASGDTGTQSKIADGKAHVQYPGSDPWVLSVGGTTIGNVRDGAFDEYVWNDLLPWPPNSPLATGGGISDFFPLPSYQAHAGVPPSLNDGTHVGRGVPDVAANASPSAPYTGITVNGAATGGNGTSASAPLWAGLIAVLNAALGVDVGFVNPALYAIGSRAFNDVTGVAGPRDNGLLGVAGYPAGPGWDAATGWGSPNGTALLRELRAVYRKTSARFGRPASGSVLIPGAVAMLAHKRLRDVVEGLERKAAGGVYDALSFLGSAEPVVFTDTDRRILGLAKAAVGMFEAGPSVDTSAGSAVADGLGRFAIAGAGAFELPAYAELYLPNGSWITDTIRRGTPDANMSRVVVASSQLAVRTGELAIGLAPDGPAQARIQAFSMGMLSGLASAVVVDPLLRDLQARRTKAEWDRGLPAADVGAAEQRIVRNLLGGGDGAAAWQGWWPKADELPDALLDGYARAVEEAFALSTRRPRGFADFEEQFAASPPPALTRDRLRDGYSLLQLDVHLRSWGAGTWYVALLPALVMPVVGFALTRALPHGKAFVDPSVHVDERAVWELLTLATGLGALPPAGYSIYLWTQIPENTEAFAEAVVLFGLRLALSLASIGAAAAGAGAAVRWGLLYAPLALTDVYGLIRGLVEHRRGSPAGFVFLLQTLPTLTAATVVVSALIADGMIAAGVDHDVAYAIVLALTAALLLAATGIPLAVALARGGGLRSILMFDRPQLTEALQAVGETGGPAALADLFDDSTLWTDPAALAPTLADLRYPAGPRALLRVWWTGDGDLQISHDEHTVSFRKGDGSTKDAVLPPGKTSAADLAALIVAQVPGVQAEPYGAADPAYDLPYPHTLDDPGDAQPTLTQHDAHVHDFLPVGKSRDDAYVLRHTPRSELTTTYGADGPSRSLLDAIQLVPSRMLGDVEESALGAAADLAALLSLGAAPSLAGSAAGDAGAAPAEVRGPVRAFTPAGAAALPDNLGPVFQVFRQWNLDERRVNEWRQLVQGGAVGDQPDPVHADPGMRPDPRSGAAAYVNAAQNAPPAAPAPAPELVARAMGWVPLWRAWSRMATDIVADSSAATAMHYTPAVRLPDGTDLQPTNADLTNGLRFLLDLP